MYVVTGVCLQWDSNRAPGVRGGVAAAGGSARKYMPVANQIRSGKTWPAQGSRFLMCEPSMPLSNITPPLPSPFHLKLSVSITKTC